MKIMAVCGSGLGSSFMVEMNIKKVLKKIGVEAEVEHSDLASALPGAADVFVMGKDIAESATVPADKLIVLDSIISMPELEEKLTDYFKKCIKNGNFIINCKRKSSISKWKRRKHIFKFCNYQQDRASRNFKRLI